MSQFAVILPAAGQSSRFRDKEKKGVRQSRRPQPSGYAPPNCSSRGPTSVSASSWWHRKDQEMFKHGGATRQPRVHEHPNGRRRRGTASEVGRQCSYSPRQRRGRVRPSAIRDAARPCLTPTLIDACVRARRRRARPRMALPCRSRDTVKARRPAESRANDNVAPGIVASADAAGFPPRLAHLRLCRAVGVEAGDHR